MNELIDLNRYPLDREGSPEWNAFVTRSKAELADKGMFNLEGFLKQNALAQAITEVKPVMDSHSHEQRRNHNIYFKSAIPGLAANHPALRKVETVSHTVCADQIPGSIVLQVYECKLLTRFLAAVMDKAQLHTMEDPLARANVMSYRPGEALNWHFDRSEFTTTLLLQAPEEGGDFQYRVGLRSENDPNYDGVARLLAGQDPEAKILQIEPGTLNVFRGKNTAHRVTTVRGKRDRLIAVFSFYEQPGVLFSAEERYGFYGRTA